MRRNRAITLVDGRRLSYAEYGVAGGRAVLYFHGLPGSRLDARLLHESARSQGVHLIGVDRPGMGGSDDLPRRRIIDWPADVAALADGLGLRSFAILAVSAGAPYALACAVQMPQRLTAVTLVGGVAPLTGEAMSKLGRGSRLALRLARSNPVLADLCVRLYARRLKLNAGGVLDRIAAHVPRADALALMKPTNKRILAQSFKESIARGAHGATRDLVLLTRAWGFELSEIDLAVQLWHGQADTVIPLALARYLAGGLVRAEVHFLPHQGHYSIALEYGAQILACGAG